MISGAGGHIDMPFRYAHYWLLALFPLIVISFWPGYFGHLANARMAQHAHGMTATAWLALLMVQIWSAHRRHFAWHRATGLAVFVIVPLFAAAAIYGVRDMAAEMNAGSPFEAFAAPALAPDDLSSIVALVAFVAAALAARRRVGRHAAWMLATALLVLPPMTTRLIQVVVRLVGAQPPSLWISFVLGQSVTIGVALVLAWRRPTDARPFLVLTVLTLAQIASYPLLGPSAAWRAGLGAFGSSSPLPSAIAAAALALATLVLAWRSVPSKGHKPTSQQAAST
jgi:hypothetical protein